MPSDVEHELRFAGELLPAHEAQVVRVRVLPLGRVVRVSVREVRAAALVDDGRRGHRGCGDAVPVQYLLVLIVMVQQLELLLVCEVNFFLLKIKK